MASEALTQQRIMLGLADIGQAWRNNSGAFQDETGRWIRYGLANTSKQLNEEIKSSDIIGITPVQAYTVRDGWTTLGVFTAIECKHPTWHIVPSDKRAIAQDRFMALVREQGGYAGFATDPADLYRIIHRDQP